MRLVTFLVIIGILIAIQINNWNDKRIEKRIEKRELDVALHSMIEELNQNIEFLKIEKEDKQNKILALDKIRNDASSDPELRQILSAFGNEIKSKEFINIYIVLKDKKKISLIQSKQLRDKSQPFMNMTMLVLGMLIPGIKSL